MSSVKKVDWDAGHTPATGTLNAAYTALAVAALGHETGLPVGWVMAGAGVGAIGSAIGGAARETPLSGGSLALRASAWLAGGGWASWALTQPTVWTWGVVGPMLATACGLGSLAGALGVKRRRAAERADAAYAALTRVKQGREWIERIERVCMIKDVEVLAIEPWRDNDGRETGAGFDLEIKMPPGGRTWRDLAGNTEGLASDAGLPEGCGIEVYAGAGRNLAIVKVQLVNALLTTQNVPHDASELSFEGDFDIGVLRDGGLATVNLREFSMMMAGAKRTGKTNELLAIITRLLRMPDLLVWVIDFNGGGVALQWLRMWDDLGRPGRPPIDWVASTADEAEHMAQAAVRIAKARKIEYQQLMADANTDLLPLDATRPGIVIVTDEGAEVYADPKTRRVAEPMKEVLRIAGSSGVNQINCFLRATADTTGDTIIKSQSQVRVGMRMADEAEISYLLGWKSGVSPQDMPDRGYGALTLDESKTAAVFRGWRVLPADIRWFVENTAKYRKNAGLDEVSRRAAGAVYEGRWADDRASYIFTNTTTRKVASTVNSPEPPPPADDSTPDIFSGLTPKSVEEAKRDAWKAIEDAGGPTVNEQADFQRVLREAGVDPMDIDDPTKWPDGVRPTAPESASDNDDEDLRAVVFGLVKAMTPNGGISIQEILNTLAMSYDEDEVPHRNTVTRWLREDDRIHKPTGYGKYAVKPEEES